MPRRLKGLSLSEISVVGNPAQQHAVITVTKNADGNPTGLQLVTKDKDGNTQTQQIEVSESFIDDLVRKLKEDGKMPELTLEDVTKELEAQKEANETQKTANERLTSIVGLNADERAYFDSLETTEKEDAFLAKSADDRSAEIEAANKSQDDDDPVVYTTADGVNIRKSAGEAVIEALKSNDRIRKENAELKKARENDRLEKAAVEKCGNLPGDVAVGAAIVKALEGIEDEETRKAAFEALKAGNDAMGDTFTTVGASGTPKPGTPLDELDKLAKAYAKDHKVSYEKAYDAVSNTPEGAALYKQMREDKAA